MQAYRYALDPNATQERALRSHCGAARTAYNWAVAWVTASWWQRKAEESYGIPEGQLTEWRPWSAYSLRKEFNQIKRTDPRFVGWWDENSKEAYSSGLANAEAAFRNYSKSKRGERKGKRVGVPRFKSKRKARLSCRFTTGGFRVEHDGRHVVLPKMGRIRVHERADGLRDHIAAGTARILSATVRHEHGRWFVSFQVEVKREIARVARPDVAVGIDLGVKTLAVMADSTGEIRTVPNPRRYDEAAKLLRLISRRVSRRQGPDRRTGQKPSRRWEKANAERNRVHHRLADLRSDALHKLTTGVRAEYGTVVVEDLNVAGLLRNRRVARAIADAGFGEIRRQLAYKGHRNACRTVVANRWYPSSKTCSACGTVKAKLPLHVRVFTCDACGLTLDRDDNAARNLAALAADCTTGTGVAGDQDTAPVVSKPRGADQKTRATARSRKATGGRAGGATLPHQRQQETRDRRQDTEAQLALW
ncbi:IS607 family element RNA-guided endonuclease TnpB [Streptomyces sp. Lzd4kr]|nr:IS607 family element RNA-guided endonuclease TnpB [Streptomyces sp. Lzd4kr]